MKEFADTFWKSSDRETALLFVSMVVASYAWIITEKLLIGIAVGFAMHAAQVLVYEFIAPRFSWPRLEVAEAFRTYILPPLMWFVSKVQRA